MNALLSVRLFSAGVIVAFAVMSPACLLFVPFAVAMVYADRILIPWSAAANRAYSIREPRYGMRCRRKLDEPAAR